MLPYLFYASLVLLGAAFAAQLGRATLPVARIARSLWYFSLVAVFLFLVYYSWKLYGLWKSDEFTRGFLPPHTSIGYFIAFAAGRFWSWYLVSAAVALFFLWTIRRLNRGGNERFFHPEEPFFIAMALLLVGHPLWAVYLAGILVLYLFLSVGYRLAVRPAAQLTAAVPSAEHEGPRVSFYYGWVPVAIVVLLFKTPLLAISFVASLIIAKI